MFKKIMLATILCLISHEDAAILEKRSDQVTAALVSIGALGAAVYWMQRETNDSIVARSKQLISEAYEVIGQCEDYFYKNGKTAKDCASVGLENKLLVISDKVNSLASKVYSRYGSYVAFWNWTDQMKEINQEFKKLLKRINENQYLFSLSRAIDFILEYQASIKNALRQFDDQQSFFAFLQQSKYLKKDLKEILQKGRIIKAELVKQASYLEFSDKKTAIELSSMLDQVLFLHIMLKYGDCILAMSAGRDLSCCARKISGASSTYPIEDCVRILQSDIQDLGYTTIHDELYFENGVEILVNLVAEIIASKEYSQERQAHEMYLEEQKKRKAAEAQVAAANAQALAAQSQAAAMHEQNRIQRERNRIESERNDIERYK